MIYREVIGKISCEYKGTVQEIAKFLELKQQNETEGEKKMSNKCFSEGCEKPTKVTKEQIQSILGNSQYQVFHRIFDKQCIVVAKLPNGFTIVGESACVDPANYDEKIGFDLAVERIKNKIWELEGYNLQNHLYKE